MGLPFLTPPAPGGRPPPRDPTGRVLRTDEYGPGRDAPVRPSAAAVRRVDQELAQTSREVASLPGPVLAEIAPVLAQAQRETAAGLAHWIASVPEGEYRYTAQRYRETLLHLDQAMRAIAELDPTMAAALGAGTAAAGAMAAKHLQREVARLSSVFEGTPRVLPLNLTRILATGKSYIIPRIRTSAARYAGDVANDIKRELAVGIVRGQSISEMVDRLVRHGGPRGLVSLRGVLGEPGAISEYIAEGLFKRYRYWAERVARTETQAAYNVQLDEGLHEAREVMPDLKRRWDASIDGRICSFCMALHGQVAEIDKPFPGGAMGAPLHPNCRCRVGAWRDEWTDILREAGVKGPVVARTPTAAVDVRPRTTPPSVQWPGAHEVRGGLRDFIDENSASGGNLRGWLTAEKVRVDVVDDIPGQRLGTFAKGTYDPGTNVISVARRPVRPFGRFFPGVSTTVIDGATTEIEASQRAFLHEIGEAVWERLHPDEKGQIIDLFRLARDTDSLPSEYAARAPNEFFAELLTASRFERNRLDSATLAVVDAACRRVGLVWPMR